MRHKRLGSAVALGFGLLATAPCILAWLPFLGEEASSASEHAIELLRADQLPHPNSGFSRWSPGTPLQQPASKHVHQPEVSEEHGSHFYPGLNFAQYPAHTPGQQPATMDGHGLYGGNYPAQQDLYLHQHHQLSNQPVQPWSYQYPSMYDHPAPAEEQQGEPTLFRPVAQHLAHTPGQQPATMDGHGLYGGNYPAQQDLYLHQHPQLSNQPVQPWSYQYPSMYDHPAPAEEQQGEPTLFRPVAQHLAHTPRQQPATMDGYGLYGGNYPHQHPPPSGQVEPTAQQTEKREYDFMSLLQHPGWSITESRSLQGANHPSQHGPSPEDWQLQIQPAPQHEPSAMDWEQQSQHAPQQYPVGVHANQPEPGAVAVHPDYSAADPVQQAAQEPVPVKKKRGPRSRAFRFGQAEGQGGAASSSRPSGEFGWGGTSITPAGWPKALQTEHDMPAAASDQLVHSGEGTMKDVNALYIPTVSEMKTFVEEKKFDNAFKLGPLLEKEPDRVVGHKIFYRASNDQWGIIQKLFAKRFKGAVVEPPNPDEPVVKSWNDIATMKVQLASLMTAEERFEWEPTGYNKLAFFFDLGDFRFRCTMVPHGGKANLSPLKRNFKVVGFTKDPNTPNVYLVAGIATIDKSVWDAAGEVGKKRLEEADFVLETNGLLTTGRSRKKQKQPEQQEQAINTNRRRDRKGKQQQEQQEQPM